MQASRAIEAHYLEQTNLVRMLINYMDDTEIISSYLQSLNFRMTQDELEDEINTVANGFGKFILSLGNTQDEQTSRIYQILKQFCKERNDIYLLGWGYTRTSTKYQDMARCFGERVLLPLVNNINQYLMDIATDMGFDEEGSVYMITVNGGTPQVNIANDCGTINATQNNDGVSISEIEQLINQIKGNIDNIPDEDDKAIIESQLITIEAESKKSEPNHKVLVAAEKTIDVLAKRVPQAVVIAEGIKKLISLLGIAV